MINGHGDDAYQYNQKIKYNFSSNVFYKGTPIALKTVLKNAVDTVGSYPSPIAQELNRAASEYFKLSQDCFLFGNGATELFYLIALLYKNKTATIVSPTFSEYEDACLLHDIEVQRVLWEDCKEHEFCTDLVFICNPNNPDGRIFTTQELEQIIHRFPNSHFVIDEAYIDFTKANISMIDAVDVYKNLTIVKSLTKNFTIPGLRLGYLIGNSLFVEALKRLKMPWTINSLAIEAGLYIFKNYKTLLFDVDAVLAETNYLKEQIATIASLEVIPSFTNYFLIRLEKRTASELKKYLINEHQILVRDASNFKGISGEFIRVAVQNRTSNLKLVKALEQWSMI